MSNNQVGGRAGACQHTTYQNHQKILNASSKILITFQAGVEGVDKFCHEVKDQHFNELKTAIRKKHTLVVRHICASTHP